MQADSDRHLRARWDKKKPHASRGLSWRRRTGAETKKAGVVPASPLHACIFGLAVAALVGVRREQPSAAARLGAVDAVSVRRLAALGLLGLRRFCWPFCAYAGTFGT